MRREGSDHPSSVFVRSPVPGVPVEAIHYLLTLTDEIRISLGNFLLDSTVEGFDGTPETSMRLWKEELKRRLDEAVAHPERLLTSEEVLQHLHDHLNQLRRTLHPDHLHGYYCKEYFSDGWAEKGHLDEKCQTWLIEPFDDLSFEQRYGFFAVGGLDGIRFCYRYGHRGLWAFHPICEEFQYLAPTITSMLEGLKSGTITL